MKYNVAVLGATGMVGQRFVELLSNHPWFDVKVLAASKRSAKKKYADVMVERWLSPSPIPKQVKNLEIQDLKSDINRITKQIDVAFCAVSMPKEKIRVLEETYAEKGVFVVSNNSAHRWTKDVPMIIPEVNPDHVRLIKFQRKNRGWSTGGIAVKSNCSIQSYVPALTPLRKYGPLKVHVSTYQAISGAGDTFKTCPEMLDNVIPFIEGEVKKSEDEPKKIWGKLVKGNLKLAEDIQISAHCVRVPVTDGHLATIWVRGKRLKSIRQIQTAWHTYYQDMEKFPSSPKQFLMQHQEKDRPQTRLDRNLCNGMSVHVSPPSEDEVMRGFKFSCLSHNTLRGAAGGSVLLAELLVSKGYITHQV